MITMETPFRPSWRHRRRGAVPTTSMYRVTDRLHEGRTADVPCHQIVTTVSAWLAELGAHSPLVEDLARSIDVDDWPTACAIGEYLSVDVTVVDGTPRGAFDRPF
jgi:hypothetical protein